MKDEIPLPSVPMGDVPVKDMTLRDHFAAAALNGLVKTAIMPLTHERLEAIAIDAYSLADALLVEREQSE